LLYLSRSKTFGERIGGRGWRYVRERRREVETPIFIANRRGGALGGGPSGAAGSSA
jgi:hypothetical protein